MLWVDQEVVVAVAVVEVLEVVEVKDKDLDGWEDLKQPVPEEIVFALNAGIKSST